MLAQVQTIDTIECQTPLEAALLECDEIKKWQPPYNILLKAKHRTLIFYNYEFNDYAYCKDTIYYNGPFKPFDAMASLLLFNNSLKQKTTTDCFHEEITAETLQMAWVLFGEQHGFSTVMALVNPRYLLVIGYHLLTHFEATHGRGNFETWWSNEKKQHPEDGLLPELRIAQKIFRLLMRAAAVKRRSRHLNQLYNSTLEIAATQQCVHVINGSLYWNVHAPTPLLQASAHFDIADYDRLTILLSAKNKAMIRLRQSHCSPKNSNVIKNGFGN